MSTPSAIKFPGSTRIHMALAVSNLERSRAFYELLLGVPPTKVRPGYAKFEPANPSVNLTLNEVAAKDSLGKRATHYGVQVKSTDAVQQAAARLKKAGLPTDLEEDTTCCFAVQDKIWVTDPDGNRWEIFVVTDANASQPLESASACCAPAAGAASAGC